MIYTIKYTILDKFPRDVVEKIEADSKEDARKKFRAERLPSIEKKHRLDKDYYGVSMFTVSNAVRESKPLTSLQLRQTIREEIRKSHIAEVEDDNPKAPSLVSLILAAINQVDDNLSYKDLAEAISVILIEEYGEHNFAPFMEVLHNKLGIK